MEREINPVRRPGKITVAGRTVSIQNGALQTPGYLALEGCPVKMSPGCAFRPADPVGKMVEDFELLHGFHGSCRQSNGRSARLQKQRRRH